jgi:hypothetical protein
VAEGVWDHRRLSVRIKARVRDGYLVSVEPVNLPEGTEVEMTAIPNGFPADEQMTETNWPTTKEALARLLARMDSREPLQMSEEELERWNQVRKEDKDWELANSETRVERLQKVWE